MEDKLKLEFERAKKKMVDLEASLLRDSYDEAFKAIDQLNVHIQAVDDELVMIANSGEWE